jgi:hypothetical protein
MKVLQDEWLNKQMKKYFIAIGYNKTENYDTLKM